MVRVPASAFSMGNEGPDAVFGDGEGPVRRVQLRSFGISPTAVSNAEFAEFVEATGHVTEAEHFGWSFVFGGFVANDSGDVIGSVAAAPWWRGVRGANWRAPEGPGTGIESRLDHPVVHVSWNDAVAYCGWRGTRLPTEAEWERAARGGLEGVRYPWGDDVMPEGEHRCNIWQGEFPSVDTGADGYVGTAPVDAFPPNRLGLYNTSGNVWEWCADWWNPHWHLADRPETRFDPIGPEFGSAKVMRGGSYLCHDSYCNRYRVSARTSATPDSTTGHTGFRTAAD
jgi:formylglycine-generating enzyme required for sulfatase activity